MNIRSVALLLIACAAGCGGPKKFNISGTVTRDGKALEWKSDNSFLLVLFAPVDREHNMDVYRAETDRVNGTYTITGIPPGEYIVSIQQMDPQPGTDLLQYKFELGNSPIRKEVKENGQIIDIDLPKDLPSGGGGPKMPSGKAPANRPKKKKDADNE